IHLDYQFTAGLAQSRFLKGLTEGRFLGQRCPKCGKVYVPPRGSCATDGVPTTEQVDLPHVGTVTSFCIVNVQFYGQAMEVPYERADHARRRRPVADASPARSRGGGRAHRDARRGGVGRRRQDRPDVGEHQVLPPQWRTRCRGPPTGRARMGRVGACVTTWSQRGEGSASDEPHSPSSEPQAREMVSRCSMRDVAIISFAQSTHVRAVTNANEVEMLMPVTAAAIERAGMTKNDIGFTCSGSTDYLAGTAFSFVSTLDGV